MTDRHQDDREATALHNKRRLFIVALASSCFVMMVAFAVQRVSAQSSDVHYVYDEIGRLVAVISPSGDAAIYHYDGVGNILSIERQASGTVSVLEFTPGSGPSGTTVTIYGTGFSSTPAQNTVTFNGAAATVSSSTSTQIVTTVPAGATTGAIAVTSPNGSASSSTSFVVGSTAPTITSISPQIAVAGTAVTINGTNFDLTAANDRVKFNNSFAVLSSVSASAISTTVPSQTGSGWLTVSTPNGSAASDFFIPPSPFTASDVQVTDRMAVGDVKTVSIAGSGKIALIVFDGVKNQRVSLKLSSVTITSSSVQILKPDGTQLASQSVGTTGGFIDTQTLPTTGTYSVLIDPASTYTGSMTLTLYNVPADVTGAISVGGASVSVTTTTPGQRAILTFAGTSGQRVSLNMTGVTIATSTVQLRKSDGTVLVSLSVGTAGDFSDPQTLPSTGTYTVLIDPTGTSTGNMTLALYDVPADITGSISAGGSSVTVTITAPGQNAVLTFSGTAAQRVSLRMTSVTISTSSVQIRKPDGIALAALSVGTSGDFIDTQTLPTTGSYTILINPVGTYTGSMTLTLYNVPSDVTGSLTIGGSAVPVTITTPGQNGALTFAGTTGQQVTVHMTSNTIAVVTVKLLRPNGSIQTLSSSGSSSFNLSTQTLGVTGTFTVVIDPSAEKTGSLNVNVTSP
jgi:YD repeat-containing protein